MKLGMFLSLIKADREGVLRTQKELESLLSPLIARISGTLR